MACRAFHVGRVCEAMGRKMVLILKALMLATVVLREI
jgi:hypothetical protein